MKEGRKEMGTHPHGPIVCMHPSIHHAQPTNKNIGKEYLSGKPLVEVDPVIRSSSSLRMSNMSLDQSMPIGRLM